MAQRKQKAAEQTRRLVFSALGRQRVITMTQSGKSIVTQSGVRFGSMNPPVKKESPTEESAAAEIASEAERLIGKGFQELTKNEYDAYVKRLRLSCADDDLRRYPASEEEPQYESGEDDDNAVDGDITADGGEGSGLVSLGQRAAEVILANTELKACKTLELIMPPLDLAQTIKLLAMRKSALNIETLILKAAALPDGSADEGESYGEADYEDYEENWVSVPCDLLGDAFPKAKRLRLSGAVWCLEGEQCGLLEEIEAEKMLIPSIRLPQLKRLKFERSDFYSEIEIGENSKPISPASLIADCCPKLESLDMDVGGDVDILEDILTSPLCARLTSLKIGVFHRSDMDSLFLLFTRFTARLSQIEDFTLILYSDSANKANINRLKAFPLRLNLELV